MFTIYFFSFSLWLHSIYGHEYNWLSLAMSSSSYYSPKHRAAHTLDKNNYRLLCDRLPGLNPVQKTMCEQHPLAMPSVARGARDSLYECQMKFKNERWNCSERFEVHNNTVNGNFHQDLLGTTIRAGNKETAFLYAITSAGIVHAITRGCSTGNLTVCGCDNQPGNQRYTEVEPTTAAGKNQNQFTWDGCSDDAAFGVRFAREFLDKYEKQQFAATHDVSHLMNLHNNFVGREAITQNMRKHCRCHGVSGSCEFKTCWLQMPKFSEVGEMLKQRYNHFAVQVAKRAKKKLRRKERSERKIPLRGNEIAYINRSPSYCERNDKLGIYGTRGRECNQTSLSSDSCDLLCCGRGYDTREVRRTVQCHCKFVWCCHVKCKECTENVLVHTCK
ncbi:hypothetical protein QR680_003456 [Steinernema hermaphroditum]|uniref:Protein Wnt n=1 Tax=Steinernema hermaphroditum TaxID=289476 RepID=A0AA39H6V5_9BILA|nr:hypothetical protein QR680_003456 [Steinernema hermaphroditum]